MRLQKLDDLTEQPGPPKGPAPLSQHDATSLFECGVGRPLGGGGGGAWRRFMQCRWLMGDRRAGLEGSSPPVHGRGRHGGAHESRARSVPAPSRPAPSGPRLGVRPRGSAPPTTLPLMQLLHTRTEQEAGGPGTATGQALCREQPRAGRPNLATVRAGSTAGCFASCLHALCLGAMPTPVPAAAPSPQPGGHLPVAVGTHPAPASALVPRVQPPAHPSPASEHVQEHKARRCAACVSGRRGACNGGGDRSPAAATGPARWQQACTDGPGVRLLVDCVACGRWHNERAEVLSLGAWPCERRGAGCSQARGGAFSLPDMSAAGQSSHSFRRTLPSCEVQL